MCIMWGTCTVMRMHARACCSASIPKRSACPLDDLALDSARLDPIHVMAEARMNEMHVVVRPLVCTCGPQCESSVGDGGGGYTPIDTGVIGGGGGAAPRGYILHALELGGGGCSEGTHPTRTGARRGAGPVARTLDCRGMLMYTGGG